MAARVAMPFSRQWHRRDIFSVGVAVNKSIDNIIASAIYGGRGSNGVSIIMAKN